MDYKVEAKHNLALLDMSDGVGQAKVTARGIVQCAEFHFIS